MNFLLFTLRKFWLTRLKEVNYKYNRVLPFSEYIVDRWEKAKNLGFGEQTSVYDSCLVFGNVKVGSNTWIGPFSILDGSGGQLTIGSNCNLSAGTQIYTHDTVLRTISGNALLIEKENTTIGSNCYIGPNTIIAKGVVIGDYVVIGANSFVNMNIPSYSLAVGSPAKIIKTISESYIEQKIAEMKEKHNTSLR